VKTLGYCPARKHHTAELFGSKLIVFGGVIDGNQKSVEMCDLRVLDLDSMRWTSKPISGVSPVGRHGHTACLFGSSLVVLGGGESTFGRHRDRNATNSYWYQRLVTQMRLLSDAHRIDLGPRMIQVPRPTIHLDYGRMFAKGSDADLVLLLNIKDNAAEAGVVVRLLTHRVVWHLRLPSLASRIVPAPAARPWALAYHLELELLPQLPIPHAEQSLRPVVEYLYTDALPETEDMPAEVLIGVRTIAQAWNLPHLVNLCEAVLADKKMLTPSTFVADFGRAFNMELFSDFALIPSAAAAEPDEGLPPPSPAPAPAPENVAAKVAAQPETRLRCHRALLAARSEYFRTLFSSGMQEAKRGELVLDGVSPEAATTLLRFVLTDQAEFNPPDRAVELLPIAGYYNLPRLRSLCESTIELHFALDDLDSVISLLSLADFHRAPHLLQLCAYLVVRQFTLEKARLCEAFSSLSPDLVQRLEKFGAGWAS
jgi:hypothetical protein